MLETIKEQYYHYSDQIIAWYNGLNELYQYGVLFGLIILGLGIVAFFILSRITK